MSNPLENWLEFPKIGLIVEGKKTFYSLKAAIPLWDSGWLKVEDSGELLQADFSVRKMTSKENAEFQRQVDAFSCSK